MLTPTVAFRRQKEPTHAAPAINPNSLHNHSTIPKSIYVPTNNPPTKSQPTQLPKPGPIPIPPSSSSAPSPEDVILIKPITHPPVDNPRGRQQEHYANQPRQAPPVITPGWEVTTTSHSLPKPSPYTNRDDGFQISAMAGRGLCAASQGLWSENSTYVGRLLGKQSQDVHSAPIWLTGTETESL